MGTPLWMVDIILQTFRRVITIAKLTNAPIIGRIIDYFLFRGDDITYLPRDTVIQVNKGLDLPVDTVLPSQVLDRIIDESRHRFIMHKCPCRTSMECEDYPVDLGCVFMGESAQKINPHLGRFASRQDTKAHLKKCREAGLVHLVGRQRLDAVWLNAGPVEKLLSVCNCCPCCCLWRTLPHLKEGISRKVVKMPGIEVSVNDQCIGCGTCYDSNCFADAIRILDGRAVILETCRGCGRCVEICPEGAIELEVSDPTYLEKTFDKVFALVDLN